MPLAGTDLAVLWRTSLLDPVGSYTKGHAARLTLVRHPRLEQGPRPADRAQGPTRSL